jgi:hypothetical protein
MLDRAGDDMARTSGSRLACLHGAQHRQVPGVSTRAGEGDFVGAAFKHGSYLFACLVEQQGGAASFPVQPDRISPAVIERREQCGLGGWHNWLGRCRIEVRHDLDFTARPERPRWSGPGPTGR